MNKEVKAAKTHFCHRCETQIDKGIVYMSISTQANTYRNSWWTIKLCMDCYRKDMNIQKRSGVKHIKTFPKDEMCVSMIEFRGDVFVATNKHVYKMIEERLHKLELIIED